MPRIFRLASLATIGVLALSGCSTDDDGAPSVSESPSAVTAAAAAPGEVLHMTSSGYRLNAMDVTVSKSGYVTASSGRPGILAASRLYRPDGTEVDLSQSPFSVQSASLAFVPGTDRLIAYGSEKGTSYPLLTEIDKDSGELIWKRDVETYTNYLYVASSTIVLGGSGWNTSTYDSVTGEPVTLSSPLPQYDFIVFGDSLINPTNDQSYDAKTGLPNEVPAEYDVRSMPVKDEPARRIQVQGDTGMQYGNGMDYVDSSGKVLWSVSARMKYLAGGYNKALIQDEYQESIAVYESGQQTGTLDTLTTVDGLKGCVPLAVTGEHTALLGGCETGDPTEGSLAFIAI